MGTFIVGRHTGKIHTTRVENQCFYQKLGRATVRPKDVRDVCVKLHWIHLRT